MASMLDYFTPGQMPAAQPDQNIMPSVASFMNDPRALNALLAFGTQAMIPQWGGGTVQFAKGVGAAGEANTAQQAMEQKQQEIDSKSQLREAQAGAAEARANTAGTRASLTGLIEEGKRDRALTANKVRVMNMYQNYVRNTRAADDLAEKNWRSAVIFDPKLPQPQKTPIQDPDTWVRTNPLVKDLGLVGGSGPLATPSIDGEEGDTAIPPGAGQTQAATPGVPAMKDLVVGQTYPTKYGSLKWDGTKFVSP